MASMYRNDPSIRSFLAVLFVLAFPLAAAGQSVDISGQVRPRMEVRDPGPGGDSEYFTSMRLRAAVRAELEGGVSAYAEFQDVRVFGEETSTLGDFDADNLDLHQGYLQANLGEGGWVVARAGRQETALGGQRLVGPVGWTQQGRSFDGIRVTADRARGTIDVMAYQLSETDRTARPFDADLFGAQGSFDVGSGSLDLYGLLNRSTAGGGTDQGTLGARFHGSSDDWSYRAEASTQLGTRGGEDVSAFMLGARAGRSIKNGDASVTLWWDYLSGDEDPTDGQTDVFDTLFGTNHKFYGLADVFLNIPVDTGGRGLHDVSAKGMHRLGEQARVNVEAHGFWAAESAGLQSSRWGTELDITLTYRYTEQLGLTGGFSQLFVGDALGEIGRLSDDLTFSYLMADLRF